ncbi:MAG: serine hydroxymethyltransferase [Elusimicrobia bacterium HGW-Elusimicrobia-2]|nr:MAG: serine hydroxymethyltransferase [Elusimicrobia bacterium HGW-Elusimicrobia-2]
MFEHLKNSDKEVYDIIEREHRRQEDNLEMIASENFASFSVLEAASSFFTNKYAEGYPGKRYYGGCLYCDEIELMAIERCKRIFGAEHANVQPLSGTAANMAVYFAVLEQGDSILSMDLAHGGHLSHGHPLSFSGRFYKIIPAKNNLETGLIDYERMEKLALENKPKLIICGASAYPRIIDFKRYREIADKAGAYLMADIAHIAGLVAAGEHPSPFPFCDFVTTTTHKTLRGPRGGVIMSKKEHAAIIDRQVFPGIQGGPHMHIIAAKAAAFGEALKPEFRSYQRQIVKNSKALAAGLLRNGFTLVTGGTDNHMVLVDLRNRNMTGKTAQNILEDAGITANKNSIPGDPEKPFVTSGIRLGTPAVTTRGMKEAEMTRIAEFINRAVEAGENKKALNAIRDEVKTMTADFPIYKSE